MNGEWILQVVTVLIPILVSIIVSAIVGYLLGSKRQKKQILRGHITETVQKEYPSLFDELRRNSEQLDNYLNKPYVTFGFTKLNQLYNTGLEEFIREHHKDLHSAIDSFRKNILPKYKELNSLKTLREEICNDYSDFLRRFLPPKAREGSVRVADELLMISNSRYGVLSLLLNERYDKIRNKIAVCIADKITEHMGTNYGEMYKGFMMIAKPKITKIVETYKELKTQNDNEVRGKLLPLLKKYISNPI